ncbi:MAG: J domain-containing protein [Pseudomonadota bacterium]|nr:J domain-containing protein [Pseudomonadota bacterium]
MRRKQKIDPEFAVKAGEQMISDTGQHICMAEGCFDIGSHPAPKNRQELRSYIWFCLDHIRMFNSQWNYYDGLEGDALEREIRRATTWERPSWKFGSGPSAKLASSGPFEDKFSFFDEADTPAHAAAQNLTTEQKKAFALFELTPDSDQETIKKRYKELAKKLHPDHNRSDPKAEDRLKEINLAYTVLRKSTAQV